MADYEVRYTQILTNPITVAQGEVNTTSADVAVFGRINLEYGELLNENLLHLLEHFACPEDPGNPGNPDLTQTHNELLYRPTHGQFWYNSTDSTLYFWDGDYWIPISNYDDVAANWGAIYHGQQLPKPVSSITGREFDYPECIWSVAPAAYDTAFDGMTCATDSEARVTMHYKIRNDPTTIESYANYLIIGIRGNNNLGEQIDPPDLPDVTPTPTPSNTLPPGLTVTPTSTPPNTPPISPPVSQEPTPTPEPPPPLGVNTRLYVSPAPCDPGTPGPGGGTNTSHVDTTGNVAKSAYDQSTYFSLQNISGGVPPYTVDFQNVFFTIQSPTSDPSGLLDIGSGGTTYQGSAYPFSTVLKSYFGGTGTGSLRTNISAGEIPYIRLKFDSAEFNTENNYSMRVRFHGRVILTDSVGATKQWWLPGSQDIPEVGYDGGCAAGGTNLTNPGTDGPFPSSPGTLTYWYSNWDHTGIDPVVTGFCSSVTPAEGPTVAAGLIYANETRVVGYNVYNDNFGSAGNTTSEYAILKAALYLQEEGGSGRNWLFIFAPTGGISGATLYSMLASNSPVGYMNIGISDAEGNCTLATRTWTMGNHTQIDLLPDGAVQVLYNDYNYYDDFATRWLIGKNTCRYVNQFCWDTGDPPAQPAPPPPDERTFTLNADIIQTGGTSTFGSDTTTFTDGDNFSISIYNGTLDAADGNVTGFDINIPSGYVINYVRTSSRVYYNADENTNYLNQSILTAYGSANLSFPAEWVTYNAFLKSARVVFAFKPA